MLRPEQPVTRRDTMTIARKLLPLAALLLALGPASPPARAAAPDYQALNAALVEDYVVPRYQAFAQATAALDRSEEHTSELQSLMRISYAVFCLKKKHINNKKNQPPRNIKGDNYYISDHHTIH